jgi:VanZ family protein
VQPLSKAQTPMKPSGPVNRRRRRLARLAWFCVPLVVWLAVIALASTDLGSQAHTDSWLVRFVHLFFAHQRAAGSPDNLSALSWAVRKTAHVVEYAVLGALVARALKGLFPGYTRGAGRELLLRTALVVLPFGVVVAVFDEFHQTFVNSRMGSPRDAAIDLLGLCLGLLLVWAVWRRRAMRVQLGLGDPASNQE